MEEANFLILKWDDLLLYNHIVHLLNSKLYVIHSKIAEKIIHHNDFSHQAKESQKFLT